MKLSRTQNNLLKDALEVLIPTLTEGKRALAEDLLAELPPAGTDAEVHIVEPFVFAVDDAVDKALVSNALLHYRHHLNAEIEMSSQDPNDPDFANANEWLERTKLLERTLTPLL